MDKSWNQACPLPQKNGNLASTDSDYCASAHDDARYEFQSARYKRTTRRKEKGKKKKEEIRGEEREGKEKKRKK